MEEPSSDSDESEEGAEQVRAWPADGAGIAQGLPGEDTLSDDDFSDEGLIDCTERKSAHCPVPAGEISAGDKIPGVVNVVQPVSPVEAGYPVKNRGSPVTVQAAGVSQEAEGHNSENFVDQLYSLLEVDRFSKVPIDQACQVLMSKPLSKLHLVIWLTQLLLSHPRDGNFVAEILKRTWPEKEDTPSRRDLLPFQFCPPVGAAVKLLKSFPKNHGCYFDVKLKFLNNINRQQRGRLIVEGSMQLLRWLVIMVLNGEYYDWDIHRASTCLPSKPSLSQTAAVELITKNVRTFMKNPMDEMVFPNFNEVMKAKDIDYGGDEVSNALPLRLEELLPGLPDSQVGGSLDALEVVDADVKAWLENPGATLKPKGQWPSRVPVARINASREEWYRVVEALYQRRILTTIEESEIFKVNGELVLNGAFAVGKSGTPAEGEKRITRLIMNMVPSNSYQMLMRGDLQTLSSSSNWASIILPQGYSLLWSSDDQRGAFYAWKLPPQWRGLMAFRWKVPGHLVGQPGVSWCYVCSQVIPMGWLNAVSLFQHLHRRLGMAGESLGAGFAERMEWRRDRAVPQGSLDKELQWVQYYLDDFDTPEVVASEKVDSLKGSISEVHMRQRLSYERRGVEISEKKSQKREPVVIRMGAQVNGIEGTLSAPPQKMWEVLGFVLWAFQHKRPSNKSLMMILGRLVRCFEFRRPLMSLLRDCWPKGHVSWRIPLRTETRRSLVRACLMMCMAVADLRSAIDGLVSASDASEDGGGLCVSACLTDEGRQILKALHGENYQATRCMPFQAAGAMPVNDPQGPKIFVISLFDGVAAIMCALSRLPCIVVGFAASEIDKDCKRLVRKRWPGVIELGRVEDINERTIEAIVTALGFSVDGVLISAGSPCQDLTRLLSGRKGLAGSRSRLFFEIPRIVKLCKARFPSRTWFMVENVDSMTEENKLEFSRVLGVKPILLEAHTISGVRRPRLYWCSWPVAAQGDEVLVDGKTHIHWQIPNQGPHVGWLDEGWSYLGGRPLPTFTRALPRSTPPKEPAGLQSASPVAIRRWQQDRHRFQVYQYEDKSLVWKGHEWRLPSLKEREKLMGFSEGYISNALSPKLSADEQFNLGCCMIGNTFHVGAVTLLCHTWISFLYPMTPPRCMTTLLQPTPPAPAGWTSYPKFEQQQPLDPDCPQLVQEILRQGDRAGTDIRLDVGVPFRFKAYPRSGLRTSLFSWRIVHGYSWKHSAHINALELQAVVNSLQWRLRKLTAHRKRVLHLVDSQVVASVVSKGRSSSFRLRKGLQRLNTLLLASGIRLSVGYIHTTDNPADIPSRWASMKRSGKPVKKLVKA